MPTQFSVKDNSPPITNIIDLKPGMKNLSIKFIVLERCLRMKTKEGGVIIQHVVADSTASIKSSLWDDKGEALEPGDIFIMSGGYASLYKSSLMLYCSRYGVLERIGEFMLLFSEAINVSSFDWSAYKDPQFERATDNQAASSNARILLGPGSATPHGGNQK